MIGKLSALCLLLIMALTACTNGHSTTAIEEPSAPTPVSPPDGSFITPTIDFEVDVDQVPQDALDFLINDVSLLALLDDFLTVRTIQLSHPPLSYKHLAALSGDFDAQIINCAEHGVINLTGYIRQAGAISSGDLHGYEIGECIEKRGQVLSGSYLRRFLASAGLEMSGSQPKIRHMWVDVTYDQFSTRIAEPHRQVILAGKTEVELAPVEYPRRGTFNEQFITSDRLRVDYSATEQQGYYLLQELAVSEYFDMELDAPVMASSALIYSSKLQGSYYIHGADVNDENPWYARFILMGKDGGSVIVNIDAMRNIRYALDSDGDGEYEAQATYSALNYLDLSTGF